MGVVDHTYTVLSDNSRGGLSSFCLLDEYCIQLCEALEEILLRQTAVNQLIKCR